MTFGINQIAASICFFCLATALIGQEAVYVQRATTSGIMSVEYPIKVNQSHVLTFITSNGLYLVRLDSIDAQLVQVPDTKAATYCGYEYSGDTLFGYTLYFTPGMFRINPDLSSSSILLPPQVVNVDRPSMSENSPWKYNNALSADSSLVSTDQGRTWMQLALKGSARLPASNPNCLYLADGKDVRLLRKVNGELQVRRLPFFGHVPTSIAHIGRDSLYWIDSDNRLSKGALDSSSGLRVDTVMVGGVEHELNPFAVLGLSDSSLLYLDDAGWAATVSKGEFHESSIRFQTGGSLPITQPRGDYSYVLRYSQPNSLMYRFKLTSPPVVDFVVLPEGVNLGVLHNRTAKLYDLGDAFGESEYIEYLVLFSENECVVTGSLLSGIEVLPRRSMIYSWLTQSAVPMVLTSLEQVVCVDRNRRGLLRRGKLQSSSRANYTAEMLSNYKSLNFREWGLSVPAQMAGGLVFAGPVVRRISLDGKSVDTLFHAPNSFASLLPDGGLASGWKNVLRLHGASATDTSEIMIPAGAVADSMGYPTSMVQCSNGNLLTSFQGTWRKDASPEGKRMFRWGGVLRSSDNGVSWHPQPLPDPESNYVLHLTQTRNGTMLATCMRMVEDSTPTQPSGADPAMQSNYAANRITILRSIDCGESWEEVHTPFYNGPWQMNSGNIVQQKDGRLFAALIPGLYTSTDDGRTWQLDERVNALIVPVSVTLNDDESLLLSANDGVYRLDKLTGVEEESGLSERVRMEVLTTSALLQRLSTGKVEHASVVDLQGRETPLVRRGSVITDVILLLLNGVYGLDVNGERSVVCVKTN